VGLCYECVLDNSASRPLLELLVAASGRQQGLLLFTDYRKSGTHASTTLNLCDPAAIDVYNRHYCNLDPGLGIIRSRSVGHWYNDLTDFGPERIRRDPYYQEFHIPFGLLDGDGHVLYCNQMAAQQMRQSTFPLQPARPPAQLSPGPVQAAADTAPNSSDRPARVALLATNRVGVREPRLGLHL
jgi:hypothetical protein